MFKTNILMLRETKTAIRFKSITNVKELLICIYIYEYVLRLSHPLSFAKSLILHPHSTFTACKSDKRRKKNENFAASPTFF